MDGGNEEPRVSASESGRAEGSESGISGAEEQRAEDSGTSGAEQPRGGGSGAVASGAKELRADGSEFVASAALPQELPASLKDFMQENGVDEELYKGADSIDRHIRINPRNPIKLLLLAAELQQQITAVPWLSGIYSLSASARLASTAAYKAGQVYGIDVASAAAVQALSPKPGERILDLCCAPGAKLCMISDQVTSDAGTGFVVGVDVSEQRLSSTRTMVRKYQHTNVRLYLTDGVSCKLSCPSVTDANEAEIERKETLRAAAEASKSVGSKRSRKKAKHRQSYAEVSKDGEPVRYFFETSLAGHWTWRKEGGFDRVMVDAECTHDGSVRHIAKFANWGWDTVDQRFLSAERLDSLETLQRGLLTNGFRHLRPGGTLVYSTCSFAQRQNEDVVSWFLKQEPEAQLQTVEGRDNWPCREGHTPKTLRFDPASSGSSGLFLAKFVKLADAPTTAT